jgi:hypothetical protein
VSLHSPHAEFKWWGARQMSGVFGGLRQTAARKLGSCEVHAEWMTWRVPEALLGRERELIVDMPSIMRYLCTADEQRELCAFGHNDYTTDNAYFQTTAAAKHSALGGVFDWQQSCVNNVCQEWAWNFHWLEPEFLERHEDELIDLLLQVRQRQAHAIRRFIEAPCSPLTSHSQRC